MRGIIGVANFERDSKAKLFSVRADFGHSGVAIALSDFGELARDFRMVMTCEDFRGVDLVSPVGSLAGELSAKRVSVFKVFRIGASNRVVLRDSLVSDLTTQPPVVAVKIPV